MSARFKCSPIRQDYAPNSFAPRHVVAEQMRGPIVPTRYHPRPTFLSRWLSR